MADPQKISGALQDNLLTLLCFSDKASLLVRNAVEVALFASPLYREIVGRVYDYLDQFRKPPRDHLPDLLEDLLGRGDTEAELCGQLVHAAYEQRTLVNEEYVLGQLESFVRRQRLKIGLIRASELVQEGNLEQAEVELEQSMRTRLQLFSPGVTLTDGLRIALGHDVRKDVIPLGIKELDASHLGPARGELHLFIAPPKRGKSWWGVNISKRALLARKRVIYVTLEINERQILQRHLQAIFSLQRSRARVEVSRLVSDDLGRFVHFTREEVAGRRAMTDPQIKEYLEKRLGRMHTRNNLLVKEFPTGALTVMGLKAYLDAVERVHRFTADVLVLDYPDLMRVDPRNYRLELGAIFRDLRGLAVERNLVLVTMTQANRAGADAKLLTDVHAAEDFSKIATSDTVITYSQTIGEKELGLARLFVSNTRVADRDRFVVLISQAYQIGQFCMESAAMTDTYWAAVGKKGNGSAEDAPVPGDD